MASYPSPPGVVLVDPATGEPYVASGGGGGGGSSNTTEATQLAVLAELASIDNKLAPLDNGATPVSGPLTNAQLRASAVPVTQLDFLDVSVTPLTATGVLFSVDVSAGGFRTAVVQLIGTWAATVTWEVSNNNVDWVAAVAYQPLNTGSAAPSTTATANGVYVIRASAKFIRGRVSAYTSGTVNGIAVLRADPSPPIGLNAVIASGSVSLTGTLPAIVGQAAHDAVIAGNPVRLGGRAVTANYAAVASGDVADLVTTLVGALVSKPYAIPEAAWNASAALTSTTPVALAAAAGAGLKRHITACQAINTGTAVDLILLDGATERWRMTLPQNVPVAFAFPTELLMTANAALNVNLSAAGTVRVNAQGYTAP